MHHSILCVGHQPDEVLVGCDAKGKRQQLVLQGVRAQCALKVIWLAVSQTEPTKRKKLILVEYGAGGPRRQKTKVWCKGDVRSPKKKVLHRNLLQFEEKTTRPRTYICRI